MEEIPDDVFAPSVSEMDGVQPGPRRQQHFGVSTHYWMAKKILYVVNSMSSLFYKALFFYNIWHYKYNIYTYVCIYLFIDNVW